MQKTNFFLFFLILIIIMALIFLLNKNALTPQKPALEGKCITAQSLWEIYPLEINDQDVYASFLSIPVPTFSPGFTPEPPPSYIPEPPPGTPNLSPMTPEESEEYAISQQLVDLDVDLRSREILPMGKFDRVYWCPEKYDVRLVKSWGFDAIAFSSRICGSDKTFVAVSWSGVIHTIELIKEGEEIKEVCHENEYIILPDALYVGYFMDSQGQKIQAVFEAKDGKQPIIPNSGEGIFNITLYFLHINKNDSSMSFTQILKYPSSLLPHG